MSMWLSLAPIPAGRDSVTEEDFADAFSGDFLSLALVAEFRAAAETGREEKPGSWEWVETFPALARCLGHGCAELGGFEFGYGPAYLIPAAEIADTLAGLVAEGWCPGDPVVAEGEDEDDEDDEDIFVAIARVLATALASGGAVAGGVG